MNNKFKKLIEKIVHVTACKTSYSAKYLRIIFDKVDGYMRNVMEPNILHYFILTKGLGEYLIESDILRYFSHLFS